MNKKSLYRQVVTLQQQARHVWCQPAVSLETDTQLHFHNVTLRYTIIINMNTFMNSNKHI